MRVQVRPADLFHECRVVLGEASLDLVEDPLLVIVERHPVPPVVEDPTARHRL
jgi:hypothetical protein